MRLWEVWAAFFFYLRRAESQLTRGGCVGGSDGKADDGWD